MSRTRWTTVWFDMVRGQLLTSEGPQRGRLSHWVRWLGSFTVITALFLVWASLVGWRSVKPELACPNMPLEMRDDRWKMEIWDNRAFTGSTVEQRYFDPREDGGFWFLWESGGPSECTGTDNFAVRFARRAYFTQGRWSFLTITDDAVRLWVDDELVIDRWRDMTEPTYARIELDLSEGWHTLRMDYYENTGRAIAVLEWTPAECEADDLPVVDDAWKVEIWDDVTFTGRPVEQRHESWLGLEGFSYDWDYGRASSCTGTDNFAIRFTRRVNFDQSGKWVFTTRTDDGVRLWVDDELVIDLWQDLPLVTLTGEVNLGAGWHTVRMDYYESGGRAEAALKWSFGRPNTCPNSELETRDDTWKMEIWDNRGFNGATVEQRYFDPREDGGFMFLWESAGPSECAGTDDFGVRFTRRAYFTQGDWYFTTVADDGVRLWVDDRLVIDRWQDMAPSNTTKRVELSEGWHTLTMTYYENTGRAIAWLEWALADCPMDDLTVADDVWRLQIWDNREFAGPPVEQRYESWLGLEGFSYNWGEEGRASNCVGLDDFAVRFARRVYFDRSGIWEFETTTDDGVRLWLDGTLVIDNWRDMSPTKSIGQVPVDLGQHTVRMDYYENQGGAVAALKWSFLGERCPSTWLDRPNDRWKLEIWDNREFWGMPVEQRYDAEGAGGFQFNWDYGGPSNCTGVDNYAVRFTRDAYFDRGGMWIFATTTDDGLKLWVDDELVIDRWRELPLETTTREVSLSAGWHTLRMDYYESGGRAEAALNWSFGTGCPSLEPPHDRWRLEIWDNRFLEGDPIEMRCEWIGPTGFGYDWGLFHGPSPYTGTDNFSIRFERDAYFDRSGTWHFYTETDDGVRLWVDGELVIELWQDMPRTEQQADVDLSKGWHTIRMDYYEHEGEAVANLGFWFVE